MKCSKEEYRSSMCGIFFSIGFENLPDQVIDSVAHRGPDGRGWNDFTCSKGPIVMAIEG